MKENTIIEIQDKDNNEYVTQAFVLDMPYNQITVAMLKPIAKSHNIKGYYKMRKLDLYNEVIKKLT